MNQIVEHSNAELIRGAIPQNEAVHYEAVANQEIESLRSISSIAQVQKVSDSVSFAGLANICSASDRGDFPEPARLWLASTFESTAEHAAFKFLSPLRGKTVLQLGGKGTEAVKMILAGAKSAHLVSPVESELVCGHELARLCGVSIESKLGLGESIPYPDETFDVIYSAGSAHHFKTEEAFPEIHRVLRKNGKFAAIDPWRAPFYRLGIGIFGKREKGVNCRPMDRERVAPLTATFPCAQVQQFGALSRYPMIAATHMGLNISVNTAWRVMKWDDAFCKVFGLRRWGSSVAILAEK